MLFRLAFSLVAST